MVKASWGTKRTCQSCSARFYDLNKAPIRCPKSGNSSPASAASSLFFLAAAFAAALAGDELPDVEGDDALEDTDDLGDETEDLEVEVEVEDDKGEGDR